MGNINGLFKVWCFDRRDIYVLKHVVVDESKFPMVPEAEAGTGAVAVVDTFDPPIQRGQQGSAERGNALQASMQR